MLQCIANTFLDKGEYQLHTRHKSCSINKTHHASIFPSNLFTHRKSDNNILLFAGCQSRGVSLHIPTRIPRSSFIRFPPSSPHSSGGWETPLGLKPTNTRNWCLEVARLSSLRVNCRKRTKSLPDERRKGSFCPALNGP